MTPLFILAPMMDRTDRHFRYLLRCISRRCLLTTEMVTSHALLRGDSRPRHLDYDEAEHPLSLQLGGDDPGDLAACAALARDWGYDEVDLNVGCPSERVQSGNFGVCLMAEPERVRDAVAAMRQASGLPVTVKHRIGFDDQDSYADMLRFVDVVSEAGPERFAVHARKAWLKGLSPKDNRTIPPLRYEDVYRLKRERPELNVVLNGGVRTLDESAVHLGQVDGVMIGRAVYDDPMLFARVDSRFYGQPDPGLGRLELVHRMADYAAGRVAEGEQLRHVARHMMGLFNGVPGARAWRRHISQVCFRDGASPRTLVDGLALLET
jgi:tRNA-dihydrouridine synthase A